MQLVSQMALRAAGIQASDPEPAQAQSPPAVIRTIPENGIQHAGYRAIQLRDWVDWNLAAGRLESTSLYLVDNEAIEDKQPVPLKGDSNSSTTAAGPLPDTALDVSPRDCAAKGTRLGRWDMSFRNGRPCPEPGVPCDKPGCPFAVRG